MNIFQLLSRKPPVALSCLYVILCLSRGLQWGTGWGWTITSSHCHLCNHWITRCSHRVPAALWFARDAAFCFSSFHTKRKKKFCNAVMLWFPPNSPHHISYTWNKKAYTTFPFPYLPGRSRKIPKCTFKCRLVQEIAVTFSNTLDTPGNTLFTDHWYISGIYILTKTDKYSFQMLRVNLIYWFLSPEVYAQIHPKQKLYLCVSVCMCTRTCIEIHTISICK